MGATKKDAKQRAQEILAKDPEYYSRIGKIGGSRCVPKGFSMNRELARQVSRNKAEATKQREIA